MEALAAILVAGAAAMLGVLAVRRRARQSARPPAREPEALPSVRDQLEALRPDDVVLYEGLELLVAGLGRCQERDLRWLECRLVDQQLERWLLVRPQDPDGAWIGERIEDLALGSTPSEALEHQGKVYRLERCGQAQTELEGNLAGGLSEGDCLYWDYHRPGSDRLWLRRDGQQHSVTFAGQRIGRHLLCVLPGS